METEDVATNDVVATAIEEVPLQDRELADMSAEERIEAICRQVEHYFSDENLVADYDILKVMNGKENKPVPVKIIHRFNKMRRFQPMSSVVDALQHSKVLQIVKYNDEDCVVRNIPFLDDDILKLSRKQAKKLQKEKSGESVDFKDKPIADPGNRFNCPQRNRATPKKPTGFEVNFTEGPIAPSEFNEERNLYSPYLPLAERLDTALQRYTKRRKFQKEFREIFDKWMRFGGVDAGSKMFTGGPPEDDPELDSHDITTMTATISLGDDKAEHLKVWTVDFEGVAKAFLSSYLPDYWGLDNPEDMRKAIHILRNFYNYLLLHDVCPEHQQDILAARAVCDGADEELPKLLGALLNLPGEFNVACSTLFGGNCVGLYTLDSDWTEDGAAEKQSKLGLSMERAELIYGLFVACFNPESVTIDAEYNKEVLMKQQIVDTQSNIGLEIVSMVAASQQHREILSAVAGGCKPLGKMFCRQWMAPGFDDDDLPETATESGSAVAREFEFYVDEETMRRCFIGMRFFASVHTLDSGLHFFDAVTHVRCSFFTLLTNELPFSQWREPRLSDIEACIARTPSLLVDQPGPNAAVAKGGLEYDENGLVQEPVD